MVRTPRLAFLPLTSPAATSPKPSNPIMGRSEAVWGRSAWLPALAWRPVFALAAVWSFAAAL
jgi:hypothetical protein